MKNDRYYTKCITAGRAGYRLWLQCCKLVWVNLLDIFDVLNEFTAGSKIAPCRRTFYYFPFSSLRISRNFSGNSSKLIFLTFSVVPSAFAVV